MRRRTRERLYYIEGLAGSGSERTRLGSDCTARPRWLVGARAINSRYVFIHVCRQNDEEYVCLSLLLPRHQNSLASERTRYRSCIARARTYTFYATCDVRHGPLKTALVPANQGPPNPSPAPRLSRYRTILPRPPSREQSGWQVKSGVQERNHRNEGGGEGQELRDVADKTLPEHPQKIPTLEGRSRFRLTGDTHMIHDTGVHVSNKSIRMIL